MTQGNRAGGCTGTQRRGHHRHWQHSTKLQLATTSRACSFATRSHIGEGRLPRIPVPDKSSRDKLGNKPSSVGIVPSIWVFPEMSSSFKSVNSPSSDGIVDMNLLSASPMYTRCGLCLCSSVMYWSKRLLEMFKTSNWNNRGRGLNEESLQGDHRVEAKPRTFGRNL